MINKYDAVDKIYNFWEENYPWEWGTKQFFDWKHINDPYKNSLFFTVENDFEIETAAAYKLYPSIFNGKDISVLYIMDSATKEDYKKNGNIKAINKYANESINFDISVGFARKDWYEKYWSKGATKLFDIYTYKIPPSFENEISETVSDLGFIASTLNENKTSFHIKRTEDYISYLSRCPKYEKIEFLISGDLLIGIGINQNDVRILEMSNFSEDDLKKAVKMASIYNKTIIYDSPQVIDKRYETINIMTVMLRTVKSDIYSFLSQEECKWLWIPVLDRK